MKLLFSLILTFVFTLAPINGVLFASAEEATESATEATPLYAVADSPNVYLYAEREENAGLFLIPHTYYVRVTALGEPFCAVEYHTDEPPYKKISGYCKKSELLFVDFIPARPYLKKQISVTYTLPESGKLPSGDDFLESVSVDYLFYGEFPVGSARYYYVYGNGSFGYLPATEEIVYEKNTDYLTEASGNVEEPPVTENEPLDGVQIFFLVALCIGVLAVVLFVVRGKKQPELLRDENEF